MAEGYIGKMQIDNGSVLPIGSTLFGVCNTPASTASKIIQASDTSLGMYFDTLNKGVTVHIQFRYGNTVAPGDANNLLSLKIGDTLAKPISNPGGTCMWSENAVVSFTYDDTNWVCNDSTIASVQISNTYDSTSQTAISGQGVSAALETLDGVTTGTPSASKTLTAFSETDGIVTATFSDISIANTQVTGLGDAAIKGVDTSIANGSTSTNLPTTAAIVSYIGTATSGLTGAMHFKGEVQTLPDATDPTTYATYEAGDVILVDDKEYVYDKGATAANSSWILLGAEGSYALKTSTTDVVKTITFNQGNLPTLTITPTSIPNVTSAGSVPSLETQDTSVPTVTDGGRSNTIVVDSGVLKITTALAPTFGTTTIKEVKTWDAGSAPTLGTAISVGSASNWEDGDLPSLSTSPETVIKP